MWKKKRVVTCVKKRVLSLVEFREKVISVYASPFNPGYQRKITE